MFEQYLIYSAIILLLGTVVSALAEKLNISNTMFLTFIGMVFGAFGLIIFPRDTIIFISTLSIILVVFDSTIKLKYKEIQKFSSYSMRLVLIFFIINFIVLSISTSCLFNFSSTSNINLILVLIFTFMMYGIDHEFFLSMGRQKKELVKIAEIESLINRSLTLIIPLVLLNYLQAIISKSNLPVYVEWWIYFKQIFISAIFGIIAGAIVVAILNTRLKEHISYLIALTSSVILYVLSEGVQANGVLSLTVFTLILGNYHLKHKHELKKFMSLFAYIFNIFVFILIGTVMLIDFKYVLKGTYLFLIFLLGRFLSVHLALCGSKFGLKEKLFLVLNGVKGIDVAIIILIMMTRFENLPGIEIIVNLSLLFCLYSIIITSVSSTILKRIQKCH
ncbi:cation:proton antiporter [Candidatus Woesearchaeota archaeon]|nr:cation:proton antiporter [Candidatus Woesearchaeota archaeon]